MKRTKNWIFLLVVFPLVVGCVAGIPMSLGLIAGGVGTSAVISGGESAASGTRTSFNDRGVLELKAAVPPDILEVAANVGKEMGYSVQRVSRNILNLSSGTSTGALLAGSMSFGLATKDVIILSLTQSGETIEYSIVMYGKLGDPVKTAEAIINQFKTRLEKRLTDLAKS